MIGFDRKLGRRIVALMLVASAVLSIFASTVQLMAYYQRGVERVRGEFNVVETSFRTGLQNALWEFNFAQVEVLADGIFAQQDISAVTLVATTGQRFERSQPDLPGSMTETFDLIYERAPGDIVPVGTLTVKASLENVYSQIWSQVMVLLASNFGKTLAASLVMFLIFERMVTRHLLSIAASVRSGPPGTAKGDIALQRRNHPDDELDQIVDALNISRTEAQKANAHNTVLRKRLETVLDTATSGIIALNADAQVIMVNPTARHLLGGVSDAVPFAWPESIRFLNADTLIPLESSADPVRRALSGHNLRAETHLLSRRGGGETGRYVRVESKKLDNLRDDISTVMVIDDVSVQERNRQVVERKSRLDALGQLTGGIAHDFNNLLASMLYAVDLARRQPDPDRRDALLEIAGSSIDRGRELTSRLLAFAKKQPGLAGSCLVSDVFAEFEKLVSPMIEASLIVRFENEDPGLRVYCDHTQLETALMNLVLNSRDAIFRSGKGNTITIRARSVAVPQASVLSAVDDGDPSQEDNVIPSAYRYTQISVTDNGPGMDEETRVRATDPFFTTKDTNSGTGLGLSIVYGFVRQSDGDLRIYSEKGVGTTISIILPRGTQDGIREAEMPLEIPAEGHGQTVLLVEDEPDLLSVMVAVIEDLGFVVVQARSGNEALDIMAAGQHFDVLLTDVVMPGKTGGFELARRMRAKRPDLPVIYMSGYTGFTAQEMGEVQAPILQKPSPPLELAAALNKVLAAGDITEGT